VETFSFTQCACVLFERAPSLEDVERAIDSWNPVGRPNPAAGEHGWALSGPGFILELRRGGHALVDVVDRPWPDDPAAGEATPALGAAWRAGAFGPLSTPGALSRAIDQPWLWEDGAAVAGRHAAFVRLRTGYATPEGAPRDLPHDHDPVYELTLLTELAQPLLRLDGALAFFVPGGEALRSREQVDAAFARKVGQGPPPFELWSNVRSIALLKEGEVRWLALDVVGMGQLRLPDQEAIFAEGQEKPDAIEALLRNVCLHLVSARPVPPGSTSDDARGRRWRASIAVGIVAPQRPVLRWLPEGSARPPEATLLKLAAMSTATAGTGSG
jgi:hypothetical protein